MTSNLWSNTQFCFRQNYVFCFMYVKYKIFDHKVISHCFSISFNINAYLQSKSFDVVRSSLQWTQIHKLYLRDAVAVGNRRNWGKRGGCYCSGVTTSDKELKGHWSNIKLDFSPAEKIKAEPDTGVAPTTQHREAKDILQVWRSSRRYDHMISKDVRLHQRCECKVFVCVYDVSIHRIPYCREKVIFKKHQSHL